MAGMGKDTGTQAGTLDARYRPLEDAAAWAAASGESDDGAWRRGLGRLRELADAAPDWTDLVLGGARLAAAYQSGARAGLYTGDDGLARRLLAGTASPRTCGPVARPHVVANHAALRLAVDGEGTPTGSEAWLRKLHAVACAPQPTHPVPSDHGVHDHVLGHGDYKHHPNHVLTPSGAWRVLAPVAGVAGETARLADALRGSPFASLHPLARAAYTLHAVTHVGPFAAGNGRVARAAASASLLGQGALPLVVPGTHDQGYRAALEAAGGGDRPALVGFVAERFSALVDLVVELRAEAGTADAAAALAGWRARVAAAHHLHAALPAAAAAALARHARRRDLGWMPDLSSASVVGDAAGDRARYRAAPLALRVPLPDGRVVEERLVIDAHPVDGDGDGLWLRADGADLHLHVRPPELSPPLAPRVRLDLDALLDRAVTALAVRVAAEAARD